MRAAMKRRLVKNVVVEFRKRRGPKPSQPGGTSLTRTLGSMKALASFKV